MKIIIDTREQAPFAFRHERMDATTEPGTLAVGDYSLAGLEDRVAVERKSLPDLVMCLGRERERFERELARGAALDAFAGRYRLPFLFAGNRSAAEYMTWGFLRQYLEGARKRWKAIAEAHGAA